MKAPRAEIGSKRGPLYDTRVLATVVGIIENASTRTGTGELNLDVPALIEQRCGRYVRGKHQGEIRGWATWQFVLRGGWVKDGHGYLNGHVVRPGQIVSLVVSDFSGKIYLEVKP